MANFGLAATSLSKSGRQRGVPSVTLTKDFFSFLDRMVPFLSSWGLSFFFFFSQGLSSDFYFSTSKDFPINKELPRMNFVKCVM